jgi:hypothetical protein
MTDITTVENGKSNDILQIWFSAFKTSLLRARTAYLAVTGTNPISATEFFPASAAIKGSAVTKGNAGIDSAITKAKAYLTDHPVNYVAYSSDLQTLLTETKEAALTVADNYLSDGQIMFDTLINNANIDYTIAVNRAYDIFNSAVSNAYIKDREFNVNYFVYAGATYWAADEKLFTIKGNNGKLARSIAAPLSPGEEAKTAGYVIKCIGASNLYPIVLNMFIRAPVKENGKIVVGKYTFTTVNGQYVAVALTAGGDSTIQPSGRVVAKSSSISAESKWTMSSNSLKASNGRYINCASDGTLICKNTSVGSEEKFTITPIDYKSYMTKTMDELSASIEAGSQLAYDNFSLAHKNIETQLDTIVTAFVTDRPIIRFTGNVVKPTDGIVFDANNNFSVKIQNIGNKPWTGKMAIAVKDQYNKRIESSKVQVPILASGASTDVSLSIYVPKEDPVTRYNMGTSLTTYIKFYLSTDT